MKKIISIALCAVMAFISAFSVSATTETNNFTVLGTINIPDDTVRLYTYGSGIDPTVRVKLKDLADSSVETFYFPEQGQVEYIKLPSTAGYEMWTHIRGLGGLYSYNINFNNTGGTYEKIRIKLSDFSSYFNEDGTHTSTLGDETHTYNFTDEGDGHSSYLIFVSGGAITFAVPDKNGMVEIYVSTALGERACYTTDFISDPGIGGGIACAALKDLTIGEVICKGGFVSIVDATLIQKYLVGSYEFDDTAKRNADVNHDGKINIVDSTEIQKYLVNT